MNNFETIEVFMNERISFIERILNNFGPIRADNVDQMSAFTIALSNWNSFKYFFKKIKSNDEEIIKINLQAIAFKLTMELLNQYGKETERFFDDPVCPDHLLPLEMKVKGEQYRQRMEDFFNAVLEITK